MSEVIKYLPGTKLVWKKTGTPVTVVHNTLAPGGTNEKEAAVTVEMAQGWIQTVPVALQHHYLVLPEEYKKPQPFGPLKKQ